MANSDETLQYLREINDRLERMESRFDSFEARLRNVEDSDDEKPISLSSPAPQLESPEDSDIIMGLDFGTARSKAFATRASDEKLVDLTVGSRAGGDFVHSIASCVYVGDDGKIYFGDVAAAKSEYAVERGSRKRIDSFKAMITNAAPGTDLRAALYAEDKNPTATPLSDGDVLTLYLAYLTDMAGLELTHRHGLSRYVRRRFTTPVFNPMHLTWASETLRRHYAEAVLVADEFSDQWNDGIDAAHARAVIRAAATARESVDYLFEEPLVEPVAAFASRFRNYEPTQTRRQFITIADIGAGTTDFASFALLADPEQGMKMFLIPGSIHVVRKAGDEVDRLLHEYILDDVRHQHSGLASDRLDRIKAELSLQQRMLKETLFRDGVCHYMLADDTRGEVRTEEFLEARSVRRFEAELREEFERSLSQIRPSWLHDFAQGDLVVVKTGGSASLPMAEALGSETLTSHGRILRCRSGSPLPQWVDEQYSELSDEFPQLAVAIGGASRSVPDLANEEFHDYKGLAEGGTWHIPPVYKGV